MIKVVNLWHHYGAQPILRDINLTIPQGELLAVMGPNGMGKSTLLSVLAGLHSPIKGHVEIDGLRRRRSPEEEMQIRCKMFYLPDSPWLPPAASSLDFILATGRLYRVSEDRLYDHAKQLLTLFDLWQRHDAPIRSLSTGQKKKVGLCSALVTDAPILILDEPFSGGLDSSALLALKHIFQHLARREDRTLVMAVPVPELVEEVAERIAIIREGQLIACDTADGLRRQTSCDGSLEEVLERLIHPEGIKAVQQYLYQQQQQQVQR